MDEKLKDDYEWQSEYPANHYGQVLEMIKTREYLWELRNEYFSIEENKLNIKENLHFNLKLLYTLIFNLQPSSIFEVGFGYGNHLFSVNNMLPNCSINGCDIAQVQHTVLSQLYPHLTNFNLQIKDFLDIEFDQTYDVVYSQAVVMHMSTERAMKSIQKMYDICNIAVILIDGGLVIPQLFKFLPQFENIYLLYSFQQKYWKDSNVPPIILSKKNIKYAIPSV